MRHINGMEVRKKRPRGFKNEAHGVQVSPLNPLYVAPCLPPSVSFACRSSWKSRVAFARPCCLSGWSAREIRRKA
jgi:hypothetical protein